MSAGARGVYLASTGTRMSYLSFALLTSSPLPYFTSAEDELEYRDDQSSDSDESFHYPMASSPTSTARPSSVRSHAPSVDYFHFNFGSSQPAAGTSRRAIDLTPQLSQAPEFRVPTHEAPQKVSTPRWTVPTPQSVQATWERDEAAHDCRNCRRRFTFWLRKV